MYFDICCPSIQPYRVSTPQLRGRVRHRLQGRMSMAGEQGWEYTAQICSVGKGNALPCRCGETVRFLAMITVITDITCLNYIVEHHLFSSAVGLNARLLVISTLALGMLGRAIPKSRICGSLPGRVEGSVSASNWAAYRLCPTVRCSCSTIRRRSMRLE